MREDLARSRRLLYVSLQLHVRAPAAAQPPSSWRFLRSWRARLLWCSWPGCCGVGSLALRWIIRWSKGQNALAVSCGPRAKPPVAILQRPARSLKCPAAASKRAEGHLNGAARP